MMMNATVALNHKDIRKNPESRRITQQLLLILLYI